MRLSSRTVDLAHSPIGAAHGLLADRVSDRALLDLSQAAPSFPPAAVVADRVAAVAHEPDGARYAPQPGLPALREAFACDLRTGYGVDSLQPEDTLITAGCNQAFCLAIGAIAEPGDQVVVVEPFYFNHDMWLRVQGIEVAHVPTADDQLPDVDRVAATITDRTRAIVVVSPGNPTGVTIEPARIHALAELARSRALTLVIDETYRNFRGVDAPPHALFADPDWRDTVISLHSFSKDFAIPGYRVGAIVGGAAMLTEALKLLDCVAISAPRIGMEAALAGLVNARDWRREQAERIAGLQLTFESVMVERPAGFELITAGAYFGWVRHPFAPMPIVDVVRRLVHDADTLVIPGTAFTAVDEAMLRFSFANLTTAEIDELGRRLVALT